MSGFSATLVADELGGHTVIFEWTEPPGTADARVLRSDPNGPCCTDPAEIDAVVAGRSGRMDRGVVQPGTYCYAAFASDDPTGTIWSAPQTVTVVVP